MYSNMKWLLAVTVLSIVGGVGGVAVSGTSVPTSAGVKNYLDRALVPGDVITAWGVYATGSSNFNVNLMKENGQDFMIHIDFRPPPSENKVVLNSKKNGLWELEIRTPIPAFVNNGAFKVEVKCLQDEFEISVDGNVLTSRFPYRDGFPLSDVKFVWMLGGSNGMVWTDIALPRDLPQAVITAAWRRISGGLTRISEGNSGVWGVNSGGNIYRLNSNGNSWTQISGGLVQVSSGASIWGVNSGDAIWKYLGENRWQNIPGALTNVDVSNSDHVWGVNRGQDIWRRIGDTWEHIAGKAIQVSVGEAGVWVVNAANNIYYRTGTYGDPDTAGSGWVQVSGKLKWVGSGKDILVGVNSNDDIYYRLGMSSSSPTGTGWKKVPGIKLMQIDVQYDNRVVGTNSGNAIYESPVTRGNLITSGLTSTQGTTGWEGVASRANDGNTNGNYWDGSCSCSSGAANNWWEVELAGVSKINRVVIYNRQDCCTERLTGAKVYVGSSFCGEVTVSDGKSSVEVDCGGLVGGSVRIVQDYNYLTICEVEAYGEPIDEEPLKNVATGKPTSQTSVGWGGAASRAVDGRSNGVWGAATCTHTLNTATQSWTVNLEEEFVVSTVVIHNRRNCCEDRLNGAKVYVDDTLCGAVAYVVGQEVYKIDCDGAVGSGVKISLENNYLTLCEVEVLAVPVEKEPLINVASSGVATQDSTGWGGLPARAIDGNTNGQWGGGSCSHTGDLVDGWWNLKFDERIAISEVVVYNRQDCCQGRISGVEVYADDVLCGAITYAAGQDVYRVECTSDSEDHLIATNLKIKAAPSQYLTLCEVKVLSDPTIEVEPDLVDLAYKKPTSQSSTGWGGFSGLAVDGLESGLWSSGTCTHTTGKGWWMVDLQDSYAVEKIWIKNREDCCSNRINNVQVYVGDVLCGVIKYESSKHSYELECLEGRGIVGHTVKIVNDQTYLTLCEVKVWGPKDPVDTEREDEIVGDRSGTADDATSVASCPVGEVVTYCEVQTGNVGVNVDGAYVSPSTGADCVAVNGYLGLGVVARAICSENEQDDNPCNGPALLKYTHYHSRGPTPSLTCPGGYDPVICNGRSPWVGYIKDKGVNAVGIIPNDTACAVAGCTAANWCEVTLVCKLIGDMEAYAAAQCPDCDGYTCKDEEVCEMADGKPTCVELQIGCENNDRCGDYGDCVPEGADEYWCSCEDAFEYNVVTGSCLPVHSIYRTVYGDHAIGDDARSDASCDAGEAVMRCHTYGAPSAADGITIIRSDGIARCEARASHSRKYPVLAVAYCGDAAVLTDPCTQEEIHNIEYRYDEGVSPSVSCPGGYIMDSCIFHSPWTQRMTDAAKAAVNSIGAVDINADGSCSLDNCFDNPSGEWCKLTAVCRKLTGTEYIKNACPTCEDVRCPGDEECSMVEDLPECLPRVPGGCEEDKCGPGECIEDGPDYECKCETGYKFDGATCSDVDECAELPCGNGKCTNSAGSYSCDCNAGYDAAEGTCIDVDECQDSPCSDTERCSNLEGSYICDCLDTFVTDPKTKECVCADGFKNEDGACVDIDECADNPCGENEVCSNTVGNYQCDCKDGTERGEDGVCKELVVPVDCGIKAKRSKIKAARGKTANVKLTGNKDEKKALKKIDTIQWYKNNEPWDPKSDGKTTKKGFKIPNFDSNDEGIYVGDIFYELGGVSYKCSVEVKLTMLEGSVKMKIANEETLQERQDAGNKLEIECDVELKNVKLDNANSADNVNWYRVTSDGDVLLTDTDTTSIVRRNGVYKLILKKTAPSDSGTYRCEFDQQGVDASIDVTIDVGDINGA